MTVASLGFSRPRGIFHKNVLLLVPWESDNMKLDRQAQELYSIKLLSRKSLCRGGYHGDPI